MIQWCCQKEKEKDNIENEEKFEEVEKQQIKNIIIKIKDFFINLFREEKIQGEKEYYINK